MPTMMGLIVTVIVVGIASSFAPNYPLFLTSVFINGFSALGSGTVMYCWMMELLAGKAKVGTQTKQPVLFHKIIADYRSTRRCSGNNHFAISHKMQRFKKVTQLFDFFQKLNLCFDALYVLSFYSKGKTPITKQAIL